MNYLEMEDYNMYDLHIHSTCSDGKYTRIELLKIMNEKKFKWASFTDHNYFIDDVSLLNKQYYNFFSKNQGVELINGIEFDVEEYPRLHILGYDIKKSEQLMEILMTMALENKEICRRIVNKIKLYYGINIPFDELENRAYNQNVTKSIIVQWLIDNKYAKNVYEAGMLYTSQYSQCYEKKYALKLNEIIDLIIKSEGIPIMAHPSSIKLGKRELLEFIQYLKNIGIKGVEVFNADKTDEEQLKYYIELSNKFELLMTSGSDFHREEETKILGVENHYSNDFIKLIKERRK